MKKQHLTVSILMGILCLAGCAEEQSQDGKKTAAANERNAEKDAETVSYLPDVFSDNRQIDDNVDGSDEDRMAEDRDRYSDLTDNAFTSPADQPLSTFSVDVDNASYTNIRSLLQNGEIPTPNAVRIEEMINYFDYEYAIPEGEHPFAGQMDIGSAPWNLEHRLLRIGIKAEEIAVEERKRANLVFLVDVSGSMREEIPLLKHGLTQLAQTLNADDRVSIVTYASSSGVVLEATSDRQAIVDSLERLTAGGSTNGSAGIHDAYEIAEQNMEEGKINRVMLVTDGDFNVGIQNDTALVELIQQKAKSGVYLSVLGMGRGNYNDSMMEKLSNIGNGNYYYLDSHKEAERVLVGQVNGTLVTVAKDVKIQIEFNPAKVKKYRLIGYANRILEADDFNDDRKDAGDIGAGHTVTALYEIIPADGSEDVGTNPYQDNDKVDPLVYLDGNGLTKKALESSETAIVKMRYKQPEGEESIRLDFVAVDEGKTYAELGKDFQFAAAVAGFGMLLRDSEYAGETDISLVKELATAGKGPDLQGKRDEFLDLVNFYDELTRN